MSAGDAHAGARPRRRRYFFVALVLVTAVWLFLLAGIWAALGVDSPVLVKSTPGQLALWLSEQAEEEAPKSLLGQYASTRLVDGEDSEQLAARLLTEVRALLVVYTFSVGIVAFVATYLFWRRSNLRQRALVAVLLATMAMLFIYSPATNLALFYSIVVIGLILLVTLFADTGRKSRLVTFFAFVSALLLGWEVVKLGADILDYRITQPMPDWDYATYPDLASALDALEVGELDAVVADRGLLDDLMPPHPITTRQTEEERNALPRQGLRYARIFERTERYLIFPIDPRFLTRLTIAVREEDAGRWSSVAELRSLNIATDAASYADERYLSAPRRLVLLNLRILNDLNLPHLQYVTRAFLQPARRNGPFLLISILSGAAVFTLAEAALGFAIGAALGLVLGAVFAHSRLLERSFLPFVVASQTVPILAFAPMVVIWLGASAVSVAVIAAYLTFFPVTINTLRGLLSPSPTALELMRSYAASRMETLWKLRLPTALPYIFTALKVSATASVVGAIIGELPSGISDGLGRAILNFSSDYSLVSTPKLWASIVTAAGIGILFFVSVTLVEWRVLRHSRQLS